MVDHGIVTTGIVKILQTATVIQGARCQMVGDVGRKGGERTRVDEMRQRLGGHPTIINLRVTFGRPQFHVIARCTDLGTSREARIEFHIGPLQALLRTH
jgi:hypothetical protein